MRPYQEFEDEVRWRQERALASARRARRLLAVRTVGPSPARVRLAGALRHLAAWIDGSAGAAASVTLRPS